MRLVAPSSETDAHRSAAAAPTSAPTEKVEKDARAIAAACLALLDGGHVALARELLAKWLGS